MESKTGYFNVGFKNVHTGEVQLLETQYGDPAQFLYDEAEKQVTMLNQVQMKNGQFVVAPE